MPLDGDLQASLTLSSIVMKNGTKSFGWRLSESVCPGQRTAANPLLYIPTTVLFLKQTAENWSRNLSSKTLCHYFFNYSNGEKVYEKDTPMDAYANFMETFKTRVEWNWLTDQSLTVRYLHEKVQQKCPMLKKKNNHYVEVVPRKQNYFLQFEFYICNLWLMSSFSYLFILIRIYIVGIHIARGRIICSICKVFQFVFRLMKYTASILSYGKHGFQFMFIYFVSSGETTCGIHGEKYI